MEYTKSTKELGSKWALPDFITSYGKFSIFCDYNTGLWCGRFNNKGIWTQVHIERKVRGIPISDILDNQEDYEVIVLDVCNEYCLRRKGDNIDYNVIWSDLHPHETEEIYFNTSEYYCENSDIFDGEIV